MIKINSQFASSIPNLEDMSPRILAQAYDSVYGSTPYPDGSSGDDAPSASDYGPTSSGDQYGDLRGDEQSHDAFTTDTSSD